MPVPAYAARYNGCILVAENLTAFNAARCVASAEWLPESAENSFLNGTGQNDSTLKILISNKKMLKLIIMLYAAYAL